MPAMRPITDCVPDSVGLRMVLVARLVLTGQAGPFGYKQRVCQSERQTWPKGRPVARRASVDAVTQNSHGYPGRCPELSLVTDTSCQSAPCLVSRWPRLSHWRTRERDRAYLHRWKRSAT